jgi:hypothetical protein
VVPKVQAEGGEKPSGPGKELVFERNDFEELLNPASDNPGLAEGQPVVLAAGGNAPSAAPAAEAPPGAWGTHAEPPFDFLRVPVPPPANDTTRSPGLVLSPAKATWLTVVLVLALVLAFAAGLAVGLFLRSAPSDPHSGPAGSIGPLLAPRHQEVKCF